MRHGLAVLLLFVSFQAAAQETAATLPPAAEAQWSLLKTGNGLYVNQTLTYDKLPAQRDRWKNDQAPKVTILSCADSRVPPELMFYRSVGDLFVVRVAGNVADPFTIASIEYALLQDKPSLWTELIVVIGHEDCGAVKAALQQTNPGIPTLLDLVTEIRESFTSIPVTTWDPNSKPLVRRATDANARHAANALVARSATIREAVRSGRIGIISAYYDFSGHVTRLP
jgi:carbonic anhydrase